MARPQKKPLCESRYFYNSQNPLEEALRLHKEYKSDYGVSILIDQAVRLVKYQDSISTPTKDVINKTHDAIEKSKEVELAALRVSLKNNKYESIKKARLIADINSYLIDCLK